ncbi:MAG: hypothetical protein EOP49_26555, partial [Sphingobacteriales bacterium]
MKHFLLSAGLILSGVTALAGGFGRNETGQKALGLGGAFSAIGRDASVIYFNPGSLVLLDTSSISLGFTAVSSNTVFNNVRSGEQSRTTQGILPLGYLYASYQLSHKFAAGLGINSPYAYTTEWDEMWEGRSIVRKSSFYSIYLQPTLSYRITDRFSVGAGLVYGMGQINFDRQIGETNVDFMAEAKGSGLGYNIGVLGSLDEFVSFSITYKSAVKMKLDDGEATFGNLGPFQNTYPAKAKVKSSIDLPSTLSVGLTDRISDKVSMAFEFNLTSWSVYDTLNFEFPDGGQPTTSRARVYEDAMAFRAGIQYRHDSLTTIRGGLFYDETPLRDVFL